MLAESIVVLGRTLSLTLKLKALEHDLSVFELSLVRARVITDQIVIGRENLPKSRLA